jgi:hypothetical protein
MSGGHHQHGLAVQQQPPPSDFRSYYERMRDEPIYVILGVQGSGTNLLGRLLTRLFNFSVMRDRSAVFEAAARLGHSPSEEAVTREVDYFNSLVLPSTLQRKTSRFVISKNTPFAGIERELSPATVRSGSEFARLVYTYRAFSLGASHLAIKSDDLWQSIGAIDEVLPNRRIILLTRDFRDNLVSVSGKRFGPIEPLCAAVYVKKQLEHYAAEYRRAGRAAYHVTFETLLTATEKFVEDFSARFGIAGPPDRAAAVAALNFRPNKMGKWKALPARDLALCEGLLMDELREFGYSLDSTPQRPTAGDFLAANVRDTIKRIPQKLRSVTARMRS